MAEETIEVYHITDIDNIPSIVEQGLKTEYAVAGKKATLFNKYSLLIQEELKKEEPNRPIIDRDKILYARIFERKKKQLEKLREHIKGLAIVIFDVNPNDVYIGDDSIIAAAVFAHVDYIRTGEEIYKKKLIEFLYDYWKSVSTLKYYIEYKKIEYKWPEILITFDIPPEEISIIREVT